MSEGDGMAEVTEADRERAEAVAEAAAYRGRMVLVKVIAAALAEEREKARAPFLAALEALEKSVKWQIGGMPRDMFDAERAMIAMEFRRASQEG